MYMGPGKGGGGGGGGGKPPPFEMLMNLVQFMVGPPPLLFFKI